MEGFAILLVLLIVACLISGPIALIIAVIAINKSNEIIRELSSRGISILRPMITKPIKTGPEFLAEPPKPIESEEAAPSEKLEAAEPEEVEGKQQKTFETFKETVEKTKESIGLTPALLEQRIGTKWVLIAGVITVIVGVGFFLKYAYDNNLIGPLGRVIIAAIGGLIALAVGEITRQRGYGIVAKGTSALGFAILYAAVFSAYRFYGLIDSAPAFALAILVTAATMFYAVGLNEILIALLSLVGGFLTPVIVSTGENLPNSLFTYVLILSIGAMLCACYRKWRAVNFLVFAGTFILYTGWFEKFYRPAMRISTEAPAQMAIALGWLGVFFAVYLLLPILYELVKKLKAKQEDVLLVLANAAVVFYYLWTVLFEQYRFALAYCSLGLCAAHLILLAVVLRRCREDVNLRLALLIIGLFFLTIAVPLYLKMYAVAIAWAVEGCVLTVIGLRYRSIWTQAGAAIAMSLGIVKLLEQLPMHSGAFVLAFNPAFGTWCLVAAVLLVCHIIYKTNKELTENSRGLISQAFYTASMLLLMAAMMMEWYWHCDFNITKTIFDRECFIRGMMLIFTLFTFLLVILPVSPSVLLCRAAAPIVAAVGSIFTMVAFTEIYNRSFIVFANANFVIAVLFVAGLFLAAYLLKKTLEKGQYDNALSIAFVLAGIFVLWILLTEEIYLYWYCRNRYGAAVANWEFLSNMYISIIWALYGAVIMACGFWRKSRLLRYIALGLFALLLIKVFVVDTSTIKNVYRIAAFLAAGITLVAVSYLYQFLKKKGFFEAMLAEKKDSE